MTDVRTGQAPPTLSREAFDERFHENFFDPAFDAERESLRRIETLAWQACDAGRTAALTRPAGPGK